MMVPNKSKRPAGRRGYSNWRQFHARTSCSARMDKGTKTSQLGSAPVRIPSRRAVAPSVSGDAYLHVHTRECQPAT